MYENLKNARIFMAAVRMEISSGIIMEIWVILGISKVENRKRSRSTATSSTLGEKIDIVVILVLRLLAVDYHPTTSLPVYLVLQY